MATIKDYCKWRGDLDFTYMPFNEVDSVALSLLTYLHIDQQDEDFRGWTLSQVWEFVEAHGSLDNLAKTLDKKLKAEEYRETFSRIATSPRFSDIHILDYAAYLSHEEDVQFAAVHCQIDQELDIIAFRGTDDSIVGWKEDFMMSFLEIPAQKMAHQFVKNQMQAGKNISWLVILREAISLFIALAS